MKSGALNPEAWTSQKSVEQRQVHQPIHQSLVLHLHRGLVSHLHRGLVLHLHRSLVLHLHWGLVLHLHRGLVTETIFPKKC